LVLDAYAAVDDNRLQLFYFVLLFISSHTVCTRASLLGWIRWAC